jgi:hypothetical protein
MSRRRGARPPLRPFLDLVDLVGDEPVRLSVMCLANGAGGDFPVHVVHIYVERHVSSLGGPPILAPRDHRPRLLAITRRWTSFVPSPISSTFWSR